MTTEDDDLHEEIDTLARKIQRTIQETREYLESLPEFEDRSERSRRLRRLFGDD